MIPATSKRVKKHTSPKINKRIKNQTEENIRKFSKDLPTVEKRIKDLDHEWNTEKVLQVNYSSLALMGVALSPLNKKWLFLTAGVAGFMVQHAIQGWCPPLAVIRRLGKRTPTEIDEEKFALKAIREELKMKEELKDEGLSEIYVIQEIEIR